MTEWFESVLEDLNGQFPKDNSIQRVLPRFALIQMTGEVAIELGVFPCTTEELSESVKSVFNAWLEEFEAPSDVERAVMDLRAEVITNANRIIAIDEAEGSYLKPICYSDEQHLYFTNEHVKQITSHVSPTLLGRQLKKDGLLFTNEGDRNQIKKNIPGLAGSRVFAIKRSFFGDLDSIDESDAAVAEEIQVKDELGEDALTALSEELDPNIQF